MPLPSLHRLALGVGDRARGMEVVTPRPAILVVDRNPEMAVHGVAAARRDHGEGRHDPLGDPPIVVAVLGVAARADVKAAGAFDHLEHGLHVGHVVLVALRRP